MFCADGPRLVMDAGNYGVPLPVHLEDTGMEGAYELVFTVEGGGPLVRKAYPFVGPAGELDFYIELTQQETARLSPGRYTWRVELVVDGTVLNTVAGGVLDVW